MTEWLADLFRGLTLREGFIAAVDILVVAFVIYRALVLVKGTRAAQMLIGLVLVGGGLFVAKTLELTTLSWLLDNLINYSIIFLIVIFQGDIRRGLTRVGQNLFASKQHYEETFVFEEVIKAVEALARTRMGALIVIERDGELEEFLGDPGVELDARVTKELLIACFVPEPENVIHDGAVIIKNLRVARAGCVLPLSASATLDKSLGTRHRAAIGITEETDAVAVVVSEERGTLALCFGGNIARDLDVAALRKALLGLFRKAGKIKTPSRRTPNAPSPVRRSDEPTQRMGIIGEVLARTSARVEGPGAAPAGPDGVPAPVAAPEPTAPSPVEASAGSAATQGGSEVPS